MKYLIFIIVLSGCYSRQKAVKQHGRASATYPEIAADYCARIYPAKDSLIKGDSIVITDTIYTGGLTSFDTTIVMETKYITKTIQLPGTKIIERIFKTDTVVRVDRAALDLCSIERGKALTIATDKTKEADKWRAIARKRFWLLVGLGAAMALGIFAMIRKKVVKKMPVT